MKKTLHLLALLLTFLQGLALSAEVKTGTSSSKNRPSFLWKISHDNYADTYCLGTIHLGYREVIDLPEHVQQAIAQADALYTEIPMDRDSQLSALQYMIREDGKTLEEAIGVNNSRRLKDIMKDLTGTDSLFALNPMKTWAGPLVLAMLPIQLDPNNKGSLDETLYYRAQKAGKEVGGIETVQEQIGFFERLTEAEQVRYLEMTLEFMEQNDGYGAQYLKQLKDTYVSGNAEQLFNELMSQMIPEDASEDDNTLYKKIIDLILYQRNQLMVKRIKALTTANPKKKYFIAVGAAHLLGEKSVIVGLQDAGFKVSRITQ